MLTVNIHAAKTHLSQLIAQSHKTGLPFTIARAGKPVARVVPIREGEDEAPQPLGFLAGRITYPDSTSGLIHLGEDGITSAFLGGDG